MKKRAARQNISLATRLRRYFLTGLATLFPAIVTVYLISIVFKFADGLLGRFINRYWLATYGYEIPGLGLVMTVILILVAGVISSHVFGRMMFRGLEDWFGGLPLIRQIYQPVKQLARFIFEPGEKGAGAFRRVVLVQYPRAGTWSLAFVTNEAITDATGTERTLLTILIPTPPSPLTGPVIFVPKEDAIPLQMSIEDAFKLIVSGGIIATPLSPSRKFSA
jgi:uncharacterized membrane protein